MKYPPEMVEVVRRFMQEQIPFNAYLGIEVLAIEYNRATLRLPFRKEFIGDPFRPALHGGVLSTLIDTAGGAAVWTTVHPTDRISTIDLRVDYLLPGRLEPVIVEGWVIRSGKRVGVTSMRAFHEGSKDTIAEGKGVYNISRHKERPPAHQADT